MIKHIVLWRLNGKTDAERAAQAAEIQRRLHALNGRVPGLVKLEVGINFAHSSRSADVALIAKLESRAALDAYQAFPDHVTAKHYIAAQAADVWAADYEV